MHRCCAVKKLSNHFQGTQRLLSVETSLLPEISAQVILSLAILSTLDASLFTRCQNVRSLHLSVFFLTMPTEAVTFTARLGCLKFYNTWYIL